MTLTILLTIQLRSQRNQKLTALQVGAIFASRDVQTFFSLLLLNAREQWEPGNGLKKHKRRNDGKERERDGQRARRTLLEKNRDWGDWPACWDYCVSMIACVYTFKLDVRIYYDPP